MCLAVADDAVASGRTGILAAMAKSELDYPSQQGRGFFVPEPMLLDTCLVQHLAYVADFGDEWHQRGVSDVIDHCSPRLASELVALGDIFSLFTDRGDGPAWAVGRTSRAELLGSPRTSTGPPSQWWWDMAYYWEALASEWPDYESIARIGFGTPSPVSQHQLSFDLNDPVPSTPTAPEFGPFRDAGDRALILEAMRHGFPAILTTDLRSLWRFRRWLYPLGVEIWRPTDLLRAYGYEPVPIPSTP